MDLALPPDIINKEEKYEVEEVWNYRKQGCGTQFLVHWKGYRNKHDQWIAELELPHAKEAIQDYWMKISSWNLKKRNKIPNQQLKVTLTSRTLFKCLTNSLWHPPPLTPTLHIPLTIWTLL